MPTIANQHMGAANSKSACINAVRLMLDPSREDRQMATRVEIFNRQRVLARSPLGNVPQGAPPIRNYRRRNVDVACPPRYESLLAQSSANQDSRVHLAGALQ